MTPTECLEAGGHKWGWPELPPKHWGMKFRGAYQARMCKDCGQKQIRNFLGDRWAGEREWHDSLTGIDEFDLR